MENQEWKIGAFKRKLVSLLRTIEPIPDNHIINDEDGILNKLNSMGFLMMQNATVELIYDNDFSKVDIKV